MFNTYITLAGDASSSQTYSLQSILDGKTIRADAVRGPALPRTMTMGHSTVKRGSDTVDRHLVRLDRTELNALGVPQNASVQLVIELPRTGPTATHLQDMVTQMKNHLTAGNVTKMLNAEP